MGHVFADITLSNPRQPELEPLVVKASADSGANWLCVPERVKVQLQLEQAGTREITLADGSQRQVPYVGPVKVGFANRACFVGALVFGDETLLGAVAMEDMDLLINPLKRELTVNPDYPNIPHGLVK